MNIFTFRINNLVITILLTIVCNVSFAQSFVHPGVSNNKADLDRMKYAVKNKMDPWYSSYLLLMADTKSNFNYTIQGNPEWTYLNRENPKVNGNEYESDIQAAYANALMWYITEDTRHADKAVEILNTWSNLQQVDGIPLGPGLFGGPLVDAAEIIRHTYEGWAEEDIKKFEDMLVYPGYSSKVVPAGAYNATNSGSGSSFYWRTYYGDPARAGNQDASCWRTVMAIGVFLDNDTIYDRGYNYLISQPTRSDDVDNESGPSPQGDVLDSSDQHKTEYAYVGPQNQIQDYGYNGAIQNYIYENGQIQESSRDQVHSLLGTGLLANAAEIAWNQGDDMYGYLDNRILLGLEFTLKYCLSYYNSYPDQLTPWEPTQENGLYMEKDDRTGRSTAHKINPYVSNNYERWSRKEPIFMKTIEAPLAHYKGRQQAEANDYLWLERTRDYAHEQIGLENRTGVDFNGWGALTDRRIPLCPGDPIKGFDENGLPDYNLPELPGLVGAENFDYFVMNGGGGHGKCYYKNTNNEITNTYRPESDVYADFSENDKGYYLADLNSGDWYNYSISLPEDGAYDIYVHYLADNSNASVKMDFNGEEVVSAFTLAESVQDLADTTIWSTAKIGDAIQLNGLVQSMRLHIVEGDNELKVGDIIVVREGTSATTINYLLNQRREAYELKEDVGIFSPSIKKEVKVFPNPTQGNFRIQLPENNRAKDLELCVYNLTGICVKKEQEYIEFDNIDISELPKGVYIIKVNDGVYNYVNKITKF
ncbi:MULTISPECIES: T9SS type A sorting domain-containing protein [unclassified Saccharicrinis]|uniref:T9SS type A sorting domain-containing protein n=1 Tax=unclassified Saccharicrinis TaxID=2646859 RepID=UPI003D32A549